MAYGEGGLSLPKKFCAGPIKNYYQKTNNKNKGTDKALMVIISHIYSKLDNNRNFSRLKKIKKDYYIKNLLYKL